MSLSDDSPTMQGPSYGTSTSSDDQQMANMRHHQRTSSRSQHSLSPAALELLADQAMSLSDDSPTMHGPSYGTSTSPDDQQMTNMRHHQRTSSRSRHSLSPAALELLADSRTLGELGELQNYFHHASRVAVGPNLGMRLPSVDEAVARCDTMGYACAGFLQEKDTGSSTYIIGRGYGLQRSGSFDFYRKKTDPQSVVWSRFAGTAVPSDAYEWYAKNGSIEDLKTFCAEDARCAGFYPCVNETAQQPNCDHLPDSSDAVLLSGMPSEALLDINHDSVVFSKSAGRTCDGTAGGASCSFPFVASSADDVEYYECTVMGSERPWCYTTRPGMWGYCDCAGKNDFGLQWELGVWSDCPVTCGGGLRTRDVTCVNSSTSATVPADLCGIPPAASESCNTQALPTLPLSQLPTLPSHP